MVHAAAAHSDRVFLRGWDRGCLALRLMMLV